MCSSKISNQVSLTVKQNLCKSGSVNCSKIQIDSSYSIIYAFHTSCSLNFVIVVHQLERAEVEVSTASTSASSSQKKKLLMKPKKIPHHLKFIDNNVDSDVLVNKVPQEVTTENIELPPYTVIEGIDAKFNTAVMVFLFKSLCFLVVLFVFLFLTVICI